MTMTENEKWEKKTKIEIRKNGEKIEKNEHKKGNVEMSNDHPFQ